MINFPNCEWLHWFCNKARFFAPQPHFQHTRNSKEPFNPYW